MRYQGRQLTFDPAQNPAVLDTVTWDQDSAVHWFSNLPLAELESLGQAARNGDTLPTAETFTGYGESLARGEETTAFLVGLNDGQEVLVELLPPGRPAQLGEPLYVRPVGSRFEVACQPADASVIHRYFQKLNPRKGPRALGSTARLGVLE